MTRIAISLFVAGAIALVALLLTESRHFEISEDTRFEQVSLDIGVYDLFDIGILDINADGNLDIFTVHHSARQNLLEGNGNWTFVDKLTERGVGQDAWFPVLEDTLEVPGISGDGLYIYRQDRWLTFQARGLDEERIRGTISIPWPIEVRDVSATVSVADVAHDASASSSLVDFDIGGDESFSLVGIGDIVEVPHMIELADETDLSNVYVGHQFTNPTTPGFELMWRDRHGFVFADLAGDEAADLFIARGGIKGQLDQLAVSVSDELLVGNQNGFVDQISNAGFTKGNCPARQVSAVDMDADGDLDIYIACGRSRVPDYPNQLFVQESRGQFTDVAAPFGLDYPTASVYAWFDADMDGAMDMLALEDGQLVAYRRSGGAYARREISTDLPDTAPYKLAIADYDNDGDLDAYAVYRRDSYLITNSGGEFSTLAAGDLGLPRAGRTANWLDYDNDGLLDLHVVPGGIYRQNEDGTFSQTGLAAYDAEIPELVDARAAWFDADNDGDLDAVIGVKSGPTLWQRVHRKVTSSEPDVTDHWASAAIRNSNPEGNHWLQISLEGEIGNQQAIGARVYVTTGAKEQMRVIGTGDGGHFSQSHYRLYFGLAGHKQADEVRIVWPDGFEQSLGSVYADQLLQISRADAG